MPSSQPRRAVASRSSVSSSQSSNPFNRYVSSSNRASRLAAELSSSQRSANSFHDGRLISDDSRVSAAVQERIRSVGRPAKREQLTHKGQTLDSFGARSDSPDRSDDEDDAKYSALSASELVNLAGLSRDAGGSKREIMQEVINKSKLFKAERAAEKEAQQAKLSELDAEFKSIHEFLEFKADGESKAKNEEKDDGDYFTESKKLLFEPRAAAVDRIKSEAEVAREAREKLEKMEQLRTQRMRGETAQDSAIEAVEDIKEKENVIIDKETRKRKREEEENEEANKGGDEGQDDKQTEEEAAAEQSAIDNESAAIPLAQLAQLEAQDRNADHSDSVPFVFDCPASYSELFSILSAHPFSAHRLIVDRILACTHLALSVANRGKLQRFHSLLFQHVTKLSEAAEAGHITASTLIEQLNWLTPTLFRMMESLGAPVIARIRRRLANTRQRLLDSGDSLRLGDLIHFSILARCFPMTDYRHNVTTPLMILVAELADRRPIESVRDASLSAFLLTVALEAIEPAKRFMPEFIGTLEKVEKYLESAFNANTQAEKAIAQEKFTVLDRPAAPVALLCSSHSTPTAAHLLSLISMFVFFTDRISLAYSDLPSYPELFQSLEQVCSSLLELVRQSKWKRVAGLEQSLQKSADKIKEKISSCLATRRPLTLLHRTILAPSVRSSAPAFVEQFTGNDSLDPVKERVRNKQLQRKMKIEKKGAIKQVKSESNVQSQQFQKLKQAREDVWQKKARKNWAELEMQQRDTNLLAKTKKKKKI